MTQFYVYIHSKPDGSPFYVGKGHGDRAHIILGKKRSEYHNRVVRKYGRENILVLVFPCESEEHAFQEEIRLIAQFREEGHVLCNMTDGGEGASGRVPTIETRQKLSVSGKVGGRVGGRRAVENKTGIHAQTRQQRLEYASKGGRVGGVAGGKSAGKISGPKTQNGKMSYDNKTGMFAMTPEQISEHNRQNSVMMFNKKIGIHAQTKEDRSILGKSSFGQRWVCIECGRTSNPGHMGRHQKVSGHTGRTRLS